MRTEGQGNDGQGNETTRAGPLLGRCGLPGPSFLGSRFATLAPARPAPKCPRLARGIVTFAATSARQRTPRRRAAAEPPLPGGEKRKGGRPCVATNVRLPRASRGHPGPANAHGLPVGLLRSPLPPRSPAPLPNAHGLPVGWLRSRLRQRDNRTPSPPGSGGAAAARRREKEGEAAGCSDKREAPTGKPWASRPCQCPRLARGIITLAATPAVARPVPECPRLARGINAITADRLGVNRHRRRRHPPARDPAAHRQIGQEVDGVTVIVHVCT